MEIQPGHRDPHWDIRPRKRLLIPIGKKDIISVVTLRWSDETTGRAEVGPLDVIGSLQSTNGHEGIHDQQPLPELLISHLAAQHPKFTRTREGQYAPYHNKQPYHMIFRRRQTGVPQR
jgi:hypothetical protein